MRRLLLLVLLLVLLSCSPGSGWIKTNVRSAAIDPQSAAFVAQISGGAHVADSVEYGMPVFDGDWSRAPRRTVRCTASWCSRNGISVPIPPGFHWSPGSDHAAAIWDTSTNTVYGFWGISGLTATTITAQDVSRSPADGNLNNVSTTGAGIEPRAGILTRADLQAGRADHALVFSSGAVNCGSSFRWPATKTDGDDFGPCAATPVPEGTKYRLRSSVNVDAMNIASWQKVALHAMQDFGWVLIDHGGGSNNGVFLRLSDDTGVADYSSLPNIWSQVDALR